MESNKQIAMGWLIGYFVFTFPIQMWLPHSLIYSLFHSIFGVAIALIILWSVKK